MQNKDNNDEAKINPIFILNDKQLCEEFNIENKYKIQSEYLNTQLSVAKQRTIDYEIIEIFTLKNKNLDNNNNLTQKTILSDGLKNDKEKKFSMGIKSLLKILDNISLFQY